MPVLAIDQGTTSTRAMTLDETGHSRVTRIVEHRQIYPQSGWVEHDPEELIGSIHSCMEGHRVIDSIGIDNQGESCLAWDADSGAAISPVIVWQDNRTQVAIEKLVADGASDLVQDRAGLPLDPYFSASKLAWILDNIPAAKGLLKKGKLRLGTTDAFFLDRLSGRFVTDVTTASRTSLMNLESGDWDPELCALFGVPIEALPEILPSTGDFGSVTIEGRAVPITASIVDQQASLYGHGCRTEGDAKITFGTGAFALALTGTRIYRAPERGLLPTVAWQFKGDVPEYALDGGVYCAGSAINWARSLGLFDSFESINSFTESAAIERDLVFVPALTGLACPYWDRRAAGLWLGMGLDTSASDLVQAVLEGVAYRAAEVLLAMTDFASIDGSVSIDGGVSSNPYFCQFLANALGREIKVQQSAELTALGTAMLASVQPVALESLSTQVRTYQPEQDYGQYLGRFSEAVGRSRQWIT
jgi:glycerol kinase